ncbi:MAG: DUF4160 domain-containing protein [Alphaproteobacteria bacterium]|nr:DUF4160 domain-containing protein [Alphaproteobacteria bacterium]
MPTVAIVQGILIQLFFSDHDPPHFHFRGPGFSGRIEIASGAILSAQGDVPVRAQRAPQQWTLGHRAPLMDNWRRARAKQSLKKIVE